MNSEMRKQESEEVMVDRMNQAEVAKPGPKTKWRADVGVIGLGTVGTVTATMLAQFGCRVSVFDRDAIKMQQVRQGITPIAEPGLQDRFRRVFDAQGLTAASSLQELVAWAEVIYLSVGSTVDSNGRLDVSNLQRAAIDLAQMLNGSGNGKTLVISSPVPPGMISDVIEPAFSRVLNVSIALNPPFMRQGMAVQDFEGTPLYVIGCDDENGRKRILKACAELPKAPSFTTLKIAELLGPVCNGFHALKVAFANEIGALCQMEGAEAEALMDLVVKDNRLNTSAAYMKPGLSYGGPALRRDVGMLADHARLRQIEAPLLQVINRSNEAHMKRTSQVLKSIKAEKIGIYGLTYRSGTDDTRGSVALQIAEDLVHLQKQLKVYDPGFRFERIYGDNWKELLFRIPLIERLLAPNLEDMLQWSEFILLAHEPDQMDAKRIEASGVPVMQLSGTGMSKQKFSNNMESK
jgi:GDP-mannose 6-dehydrogenase